MTQLDDLSDDCLMEVLERLAPGQLFKMLRANQRLNRLAAIKLQVNPIVAIKLFDSDSDFSTCSHLNAISPNQTLVLNKTFNKRLLERLDDPSKVAIFFTVFSRFSSVKSIDFRCFKLPSDLILVIRWCSELECLKIGESVAKKEEWELVLNGIGHKLVHFVKESHLSDPWILRTIAAKCPNIKRVDWKTNKIVTDNFITVIKMLPTSCWVKFNCDSISYDEDVVDELLVSSLNISPLISRNQRINRLSSLTINNICDIRSSNCGVEFAGLKRLDFNGLLLGFYENNLDCLISCQFPALETFKFNTCVELNEHHYDKLFQRMTSLKKLTILSSLPASNLPRSAIRRMVKLETIAFELHHLSKQREQDEFIWLIKWYVEVVNSLKKLVVEITFLTMFDKNRFHRSFRDAIEQMKLKQTRVAIEYISKIYSE